jgi:hypothetical protein
MQSSGAKSAADNRNRKKQKTNWLDSTFSDSGGKCHFCCCNFYDRSSSRHCSRLRFYMEFTQSNVLTPKTHILLIGIVLLIINTGLNTGLPNLTPESSGVQQILTFLLAIGFNVLIVFWCHFDSRERNEELNRYFTFLVVIFGIFTLFYYFFKTRGLLGGLILIGKTIAIFLGTITMSAIVFTILNSIL